jgi:tetratricopeptide (TPR) repeat protein
VKRIAVVAALLAAAPHLIGVARGDDPTPAPEAGSDQPAPTADDHIAKARTLHDKGDFEGARAEIAAAYKLEPRPELLFALGQLEFNLHHYQAAIDYYERFEATRPAPDQAAIAEQAIGAARAERSRPATTATTPAPNNPAPPARRKWDGLDTGLAAFGGLAVLAGGGLVLEALHLAHDGSGSLSDYDSRIETARHVRIIAAASAGAGIIAIGAALVRWRIHLVADASIEMHASPSAAGVSLVGSF